MTPSQILALENQGRPAVQIWGSNGLVSSMHPFATKAAIEILQEEGNAVDAAIALASTLSVTNQDLCGLGGDSAWLIYWSETEESFYLDGYSTVPSAMTPKLLEESFDLDYSKHSRAYKEEPPETRNIGLIVSMVPGTPKAWSDVSKRFGSLPLKKLLFRAVRLAEEGFPINNFLFNNLKNAQQKLIRFESSRRVFFKSDKHTLREGDTLVQTDLAKSLRLISKGDDSFYEGSLAEEIMQYSQSHKGVYSYRDFTDYKAVWRPVISSTYRNYELVVTGPPTSGTHLIQEMNILDNFDMRSFGYHSPESLHIMIEATKLARVDRRKFAGDPDHTRIPVDELISKEYAVEKADQIKLGTARCFNPKNESTTGGTTHFVVVDKFGNIVSSTQTLGGLFGCGEVIGGTGIVFNDRTWWMALKDSPNIVESGHRANIGHSPTLMLSAGRPLMALGSPGGDGIIQYIMQTLVNVIDYGFNIQDAIEAPRFKSTDLCYNVSIEERISQSTRKILETWGHNITILPAWTSAVGGVEGFHINLRTRNIMGGYDPRRNSLSAGY